MKLWPIWLAGCIALLATTIFTTTLIAANWTVLDFSLQKAEQFGNSFGALNALFIGGAFLLLLLTLVLQRQELNLQRLELHLQKEEMARMVAVQQRALHMDLLSYAMNDASLANVWGQRPSGNADDERRMTYVNMILSQWEMSFQQELINERQLEELLDRHMTQSPYFRRFWEMAAPIREGVAAMGSEKSATFHRLADSAYQAGVARSTASPSPDAVKSPG